MRSQVTHRDSPQIGALWMCGGTKRLPFNACGRLLRYEIRFYFKSHNKSKAARMNLSQILRKYFDSGGRITTIYIYTGSRNSLKEESRTNDQKVANPGRSGAIIFFSRVNFLC